MKCSVHSHWHAITSPRRAGLKMKFGELQVWHGLGAKQNLFTNRSWLVATKATTITEAKPEEVPQRLWQLSKPINRITDGPGVWKGYVSGIFQKSEWDNETGERMDSLLPILDDGGRANLSVGLTDTLDERTGRPNKSVVNVSISTQKQLETFLGELFRQDFLMEEGAARELSDSLNGNEAVVFGRGTTPNSPGLRPEVAERMKKSGRNSISIAGGLGVLTCWNPNS